MPGHEGSLPHTVTSYEEELTKLNNLILELGGLVEEQLSGSIRAIAKRNSELAERLIAQDVRIDDLEEEVNELAVNVLARRQPVAGDLRLVVSVIKIAGDLERVGDYAKNIAKRTLVINQSPPVAPLTTVPRMAERVQRMLDQVLTAFIQGDQELAETVWLADEEVDELYNSLFRELLTYMMEDPRNISAAAHLLFVAKNVERMGDLVTNIAERVYFTATGKQLEADRPKRDVTSLTEVADDGSVTTETP